MYVRIWRTYVYLYWISSAKGARAAVVGPICLAARQLIWIKISIVEYYVSLSVRGFSKNNLSVFFILRIWLFSCAIIITFLFRGYLSSRKMRFAKKAKFKPREHSRNVRIFPKITQWSGVTYFMKKTVTNPWHLMSWEHIASYDMCRFCRSLQNCRIW